MFLDVRAHLESTALDIYTTTNLYKRKRERERNTQIPLKVHLRLFVRRMFGNSESRKGHVKVTIFVVSCAVEIKFICEYIS